MSLTKNYYWDQAEKAVDKIIVNYFDMVNQVNLVLSQLIIVINI